MLREPSSRLALALLALAGCSEAPPPGEMSPPPGTTGMAVTYHEQVEPILQARCQGCHREGGIAPFSLTTYESAKQNAPVVAHAVETRAMPPWGQGESAECTTRHKFADDLRLTEQEIATVVAWARGGAHRGDPAKAPPPKQFAPTGLPGVTQTLMAPQPFRVDPATHDDIRCFPVDPGFNADAWVDGTNVVAGNSSVVHHVIVYTDPRRESLAKAGAQGSYPCFGGPGVANSGLLIAWAPGVPPANYAPEAGIRVAKKSLLVMQVHYHPAATSQMDQTRVELRVRDSQPPYGAVVALIGNGRSPSDTVKLLPGPNDPPGGPEFLIPAGKQGHTESMEFIMPDKIGNAPLPELRLRAIGSHMHWVGKDMLIGVERAAPGGEPAKECLLQTPRYDFNWQRGYAYAAPIDALPTLKTGDKLTFRCTYDNSMANRYVVKMLQEKGLSSPVDVRLGEETLDEMCLGAFVVLFRN